MMRKLILGLIVALGAVTTADAKGCPIGKAVHRSQRPVSGEAGPMRPDIAQPQLLGRKFRTLRYGESFRTLPNLSNGSLYKSGQTVSEITDGKIKLYVGTVYASGQPPVYDSSWSGLEAEIADTRWFKARTPMIKRAKIGRLTTDIIQYGPLRGQQLVLVACRP